MENINNLLKKHGRIFIVPIDHPLGDDTKRLSSMGKKNFVNSIDNLGHDGYIFHSRDYLVDPIKTKKDFFLTVGELPDNYLCDPKLLEKFPNIKHLTIFFDVKSETDEKPYQFYKDYVKQLKDKGYFVMAMGFPAEGVTSSLVLGKYIVDITYRLGCDAVKTDYFPEIQKLDTKGLYLFIGGGEYVSSEQNFEKFVSNVEALKVASCSFGRNIFEAKNCKERINNVLSQLNRVSGS
jgi:DhnA family fructose-bisphosphate aldolase class Ia